MLKVIGVSKCQAILLLTLTLGACSDNIDSFSYATNKNYNEIMKIPDLEGFVVSHTPNPVYLSELSKLDGYRYSWIYKTTVSSKQELKIVAFGAFNQIDGNWYFSNYTGEPFTTENFENWYSCPNSIINRKVSCSDDGNWSASNEITGATSVGVWYFIGQDKNQKLFKATRLIQEVGKLQN